jgi:hypothetical protein
MSIIGRPGSPESVQRIGPRTADAGAGSGTCYCGLYQECPHWDEMSLEERRVCSTDKRMTVESYWKTGMRGT